MRSPLTQSILASVLFCGALVGYQVWYSKIQEKSSTVAALTNQIELNTKAEKRVALVRASLADIADVEVSIQNYFVSDASIVSFIDTLQTQGHAQGATLEVHSVAKGGSSLQPVLTLTLGVDGTFDAVMRTIGTVEYAPYAITISQLALRLTDKADKGTWHADLTLLVSSLPATFATTTSAMATSSDASGTASTP